MKFFIGAIVTILFGVNAYAGVTPFRFTAEGDVFGNAKFHDTDDHDGERFRYYKAETRATMAFWYNPSTKEALAATVGYSYGHLDWDENPHFDQRDFHTVHLALDGLSYRMDDWKWISRIMINLDADQLDFSRYLTWDILLWGTYEYCDQVNLHTGFYVKTGMKVDHVYPIFGFEWAINHCWELNLIFPCDMSLVYKYDCNWSAIAKIEFFNERYRVGRVENLSRAIWVYQTTGAELGVNYDYNDNITANIHIGATSGGTLKIANRHYMHRNRLRFCSAPYVGAEICACF